MLEEEIINELRMKAGVIESLFVIEFFEPINELENLGQTSVCTGRNYS